jgi:hypothetical protein
MISFGFFEIVKTAFGPLPPCSFSEGRLGGNPKRGGRREDAVDDEGLSGTSLWKDWDLCMQGSSSC